MTQKFTFFWGSDSPFSNWYMSPFVHGGVQYNCSEQYMMYQKARLFKDFDVAEMILEQSHPRKQKFLGRQVRGYEDCLWMAECQPIMVAGLTSKFLQCTYCLTSLLDTEDSIIVEASPYDRIWGIGMAEDDPRATDPTKWEGKNLLGIVLMEVRDDIRRAV
jgi:ribA/ribD-fused uncharacterized protein